MFISRLEAKACGSCTYYVGIVGLPNKKFTISASIEGVPDALFSGKPLSGRVSSGEMKYYQIYVPLATNFTVLVETCQGNADLYISHDTYQPTQNQYSFKSTSSTSNDIVETRDPSIFNSEFYIGVYGQGEGINEYIITAWTEGVPVTGPNVGRGLLVVKSETGTLELQFNPAKSRYAPEQLIYIVYWSPASSSAVMYSICGLETATHGPPTTFQDNVGSSMLSYIIEDGSLQNDIVYTFNVLVQDPAKLKALYTPATGSLGNDGGAGVPVKIILGVSLPVAAILVLLIVYLCVRNRNLTRQLDIEIQDLPKAAIHGQSERYSPLIVSEDDPTSDNYTPPESAAPPAL